MEAGAPGRIQAGERSVERHHIIGECFALRHRRINIADEPRPSPFNDRRTPSVSAFSHYRERKRNTANVAANDRGAKISANAACE